MSDDDIRRIADAIEKMVESSKKDSSWELIADIHELYGYEIKSILETSPNAFESARLLRNLQANALKVANEIRTQMV